MAFLPQIKHAHMLIIKGPCRVRCLYLIISSTWQFGHSISLHLFHTLAHSRFVVSFRKSRSPHSYIVSYKKLLHLTPSVGISLIHVVRGFSIKQTLRLCLCWLPSLASLRNILSEVIIMISEPLFIGYSWVFRCPKSFLSSSAMVLLSL